MKTVIRNCTIVNEGRLVVSDLLIEGERIEKVAPGITLPASLKYREVNGEGLHLMPGVIDDQVHFREPGLTHKATLASESRAAVAGGITSYMDMPNTIPNTLTHDLLEEKYRLAAASSMANYSFFMGINKHNLEDALRTDTEQVCGITDDGLYFNDREGGILANFPEFLEQLFSRAETLVALHSEDDAIINRNLAEAIRIYGDDIPASKHPLIRSEAACVTATKRVIELARKHGNRLHLFHISTAAEAHLFDNAVPLADKRITAEACVHHLWFCDQDYATKGNNIKWNPAIKTADDRDGLLQALLEGRLDIIATDHAPHTVAEKSGNYASALSGGPLVQHALPAMLELYHQGKFPLDQVVAKMAHQVAVLYRIPDRGYIREGYYADLVLVDLNKPWTVGAENVLYRCGWSPFEHQRFQSQVIQTYVNGHCVYDRGIIDENQCGQRLKFARYRI